jgi:peptidoglycan hydrolase CwlO-like protein
MDKKAKKRLEVIRPKLQNLQKQLSGAKQQDDEPGEVQRLEQEIENLKAEVAALKKT